MQEGIAKALAELAKHGITFVPTAPLVDPEAVRRAEAAKAEEAKAKAAREEAARVEAARVEAERVEAARKAKAKEELDAKNALAQKRAADIAARMAAEGGW